MSCDHLRRHWTWLHGDGDRYWALRTDASRQKSSLPQGMPNDLQISRPGSRQCGVAEDNQQVVDDSDVVVVCLLPTHAGDVLAGVEFSANHAVVSAMAESSVAQLAGLVTPATDIARSVPLIAVATSGSVTPVYPATQAATGLYDRIGGSMEIATNWPIESVTAASATVAAYFRYLGTIADWLSGHGIPPASARAYVADTFAALSDELDSAGVDFAALTQAHITPGGLNRAVRARP